MQATIWLVRLSGVWRGEPTWDESCCEWFVCLFVCSFVCLFVLVCLFVCVLLALVLSVTVRGVHFISILRAACITRRELSLSRLAVAGVDCACCCVCRSSLLAALACLMPPTSNERVARAQTHWPTPSSGVRRGRAVVVAAAAAAVAVAAAEAAALSFRCLRSVASASWLP